MITSLASGGVYASGNHLRSRQNLGHVADADAEMESRINNKPLLVDMKEVRPDDSSRLLQEGSHDETLMANEHQDQHGEENNSLPTPLEKHRKMDSSSTEEGDPFFHALTIEEVKEFIQGGEMMDVPDYSEATMMMTDPEMDDDWNEEDDPSSSMEQFILPAEERKRPIDHSDDDDVYEVPRTPAPTKAPTEASTFLQIQLLTDLTPKENRIILYDINKKQMVWTLNPTEPNKVYSHTTWIPDKACILLGMGDSGFNGLSGAGELKVQYGTQIKKSKGEAGLDMIMVWKLGKGCSSWDNL